MLSYVHYECTLRVLSYSFHLWPQIFSILKLIVHIGTLRVIIIIWSKIISVQDPTMYIICIMHPLGIISYRLRVIYDSFGICLPIESVTKRRFLSPMIDRIHCVVFFYSCNTRSWVAVFCSSAETLKKYVNIIITKKKKKMYKMCINKGNWFSVLGYN